MAETGMGPEIRFGLQTFVLSALLLAVGWLPTIRWAGTPARISMIAGVAVSMAASWAGAVPIAVMRNRTATLGPGNVFMAAILIRFVVVLALALAIALSGKVDRTVFLIWVGVSYLVLLAADTHYAFRSSAAGRKEQA